jgi:hypothetical protein
MDVTVQLKLNPWRALAAELRSIANACDTLTDQPAPALVSLNIQPHSADDYRGVTAKNRPATIAAVDAVAVALLGRPAETERMGDGSYHHTLRRTYGPIDVSVYQSIADPAAVDPVQEIERLRARVAELEARDATGLLYTRADDEDEPAGTDPAREVLAVAPVSPARAPLHYGVVDGPAGA